MDAVDLLVGADYLYPMSPGLPIIAGGEVAVRDGRIVYAGPRKPAGTWHAARVIDGTNRAVLPGFVNCHSHAASLIFRSQTDDATGGVGLYSVAFRMEKDVTDEEWAALAELGCLDLLRAGVTTINDLWYAPARLAEVVERCGLRADIAQKVFDVQLENLHVGDYSRNALGERRLREGAAFAAAWHGRAGGRIRARIGTHASDTCAPALHQAARREATRLGVGMHIHTAQSQREYDHIRATHGVGPLAYLHRIGLLAPDVVCAHLSYADDGDLDAVAAAGAHYALCPTIYPRRGRFPRLDAILARDIVTGFGTDWMLNDPFEGMRYAMNAMRVRLGDADFLPSEQALWFSTMGAAHVLGLADEIGSLEAGKKADLIAIDLDRPHLQPYHGGYPALVWYVRASDVVTSVIDGAVVLEAGRAVHLDAERILGGIGARTPRWRGMLRKLGSQAVFGGGCC